MRYLSIAAPLLCASMLLPAALWAQDGVLNPEEGGLAALTTALESRPEWLGVTCWQVYEVQKGGLHAAATEAMRACAEAGNEPSMILMSHAYENGLGVAESPVLAAHWVKRAAERGYATAQLHYARALLQGAGVPQDEGQARFWLMQAAAGGDRDAKALLSDMPQS